MLFCRYKYENNASSLNRKTVGDDNDGVDLPTAVLRPRSTPTLTPHIATAIAIATDIFRPFSPGGLYVSLSNWQGFGQDFLGLAVERGAGSLYLHQSWKRVPKAAGGEKEDDGADDSMETSDDTVSRNIIISSYHHIIPVPTKEECMYSSLYIYMERARGAH